MTIGVTIVGTVIVVIFLVIVIAGASAGTVKHMHGEGSCCGGGDTKEKRKKLDGKKIGEKIVIIDGMHCDRCKFSVEHQINKIDGAAAVVKLRKNIAVVSMSREVSDDELVQAVESAGFKAIKIEKSEK